MSTECDGSSSATIYFRGKGAAEYEKFYTENCPVDVTVSSGSGPISEWRVIMHTSGVKMSTYTPDSFPGAEDGKAILVDVPPDTNELGISRQFGSAPPVFTTVPGFEGIGLDVVMTGVGVSEYIDSEGKYHASGYAYSETIRFGLASWSDLEGNPRVGSITFSVTPFDSGIRSWFCSYTISNLKNISARYDPVAEVFLEWVVRDIPPVSRSGQFFTLGDVAPVFYERDGDVYVRYVDESGYAVDSLQDGMSYYDPRDESRKLGSLTSNVNPIGVAVGNGNSKIKIADSTGKTFEKSFSSEIEWYAACDCEDGCLPVYGDEVSDEFICICADNDDEDIEKMKERIKQELLSELPPLIKGQLKAEWTPELKQQLAQELPENDTFKGKVIDFVKASLTSDEAFNSSIKQAVKTSLLADEEFKAAMSSATKERFVSDLPYQKEWIDIISAAIKAKADGEANGYPMDVLGVEVRVKQEGDMPKSLSFAASASLTSSSIEDALAAKYGGSWHTNGYATAAGKTTAQITPI